MWLAVLLFMVILGLLAYLDTKKPKKYPPGPKWWPFAGNAPTVLLERKKSGTLVSATAELAKQFGPVLGLKVGTDMLVVVYGPKAIKEMLSSDDLAGRPIGEFYRMRTWGQRKGILLTDEVFWQEQRRFLLRHLREFGFGRRNMSGMIEEEATHLADFITKSMNNNGSIVFNMETLFNIHILNTLWKMMAGVRYNPEDKGMKELQGIVSRLFATVSMVGAAFSHFPILKFLAPDKSGYNLFVETHLCLWNFVEKEIKRHKETLVPDEPRDLMDVYLTVLKEANCTESFSEKQLLAVCMDMFLAGSETTSNTLGFCFYYLTLNPDVQKKAQNEIDRVIGRDRVPTLDDRPNMPYLECVVLESMRMFSGRTFTVPHRALKDTYLNGYFIPKDVLVIANLHGCLMGPDSGIDNPEAFIPERYLTNGKISVTDNYMPFGFGKHRCMGETMARANVFLFASILLQNFNFSVPPGCTPKLEIVDGVTPGIKHYKALVTPRE